MKNTGCGYLQFTVYGLEQTHDRFAGREGAFQNIVTSVRRANEFGIGWYAGVILHQGSVSELPDAIAYVRGLDPTGESRVGWFPFLWQGRGRDAERVRIDEYARLPEETRRRRTSLVDERRGAEMILDDPKLSDRQASETLCSALLFHIERDLSVYCGGACDSGGIAAAAPELRGHFYLGKLTEDGFEPLLDAYRHRPPLGVRLFEGITWGRLASRYGDRTNDEICHLNDLPENKWATAYLLDSLR